MPHFRSCPRENEARIKAKPARQTSIKTAKKRHDLFDLYDVSNKANFGGVLKATITWGSRSPRSSVTSRTLGSCNVRTNLIRISSLLDRNMVPRYFVAFIVCHEMLHAPMGTPLRGMRRIVHLHEIERRERLSNRYLDAIAWQRGSMLPQRILVWIIGGRIEKSFKS